MQRFFVFLTLLLSLATVARAAEEVTSGRLSGTQLYAGVTLLVQDPQYPLPGSPTFTDANVENWLELGVANTQALYQGSAYTRVVELNVTYWDGNQAAASLTKTLTVEYDPYTNTGLPIQKNRDLFRFYTGYKVEISVVSITDENGAVATAPTNLYLESRVAVERYHDFDVTQPPAGLSNTPVDLDGNTTHYEELEVTWPLVAGAESYQLEWMYLDDYPATGSTALTPAQIAFHPDKFRLNSTRIGTSNTFYRIPLIYDRGYVIYRVRAVAPTGANYAEVNYSPWSTNPLWNINDLGDITGNTANYYYYNNQSYEGDLNWQYQGSFAENGKRKDVVSFFDGSLHNRQTVTKLNSIGLSLVGETYYDHQGRPAITALPAPTNEEALKFYPGFNRNSDPTPEPYSRADFDVDRSNPCAVSADAMSSDHGTSRYYSPNNPDQSTYQAYVPDAQGYPFSHVEYTPDNTGRIRRQSGVGPDHQLGSGHDTRYFYDGPFQEQLDRLFGNEVGFSSHYQRTYTMDPNGQVSVEYTDMHGRVIATALSGDAPTALDALVPQTVVPMTVDVLQKQNPGDTDTDNDRNFPIAGVPSMGLAMSREFVVPYASDYLFEYTVDNTRYTDDCLTPVNKCYDCVYDLDIVLTDECGNAPAGWNGYSQTIGDIPGTGNPNADVCEPAATLDLTTALQADPLNGVSLAVGNYSLTKVLRVNEEALDYYTEAYLNDADPNCAPKLQDFINAALLDTDPANCYYSCQDCVDDLGPQNAFAGTAAEWQQLYDECMEPCQLVTTCEVGYNMMLEDMAPNGQYGMVEKDNSNQWSATNFPLSIYNLSNQLPTGNTPAHWQNPTGDYRNADGSVALIPVQGTVAGSTTPQTIFNQSVLVALPGGGYGVKPAELADLQDFVDNWEPQWAEQLIAYHPEYCYYQSCIDYNDDSKALTICSGTTLTSDAFDFALQLITTASDASNLVIEGCTLGTDLMANPQQIINHDPYFQVTGLATAGQLADMSNQLSSTSGNYQGSGYSMPAFAAVSARCGNYYGTPAASCANYGTGTDAAILDQEWNAFKNFYLSYKTQLKETRDRDHAIANDCYNGCIGVDIFVPNAVPNFTTGGNPPYQDALNNPCAQANAGLFVSKTQRYPTATQAASVPPTSNIQQLLNDDLNQAINLAGYNQFLATGECPAAVHLKGLLNALAGKGTLTSVGLPLFVQGSSTGNYPEFSPLLYASTWSIASGTAPMNFVPYEWTGTLSNANGGSNNQLTASLLDPGFTYSVPNVLTLTFNPGSSHSFNFNANYTLNGFSNLRFSYEQGGTYYFTLDVSITDNGTLVQETLHGQSLLPVGNCSFDPICVANQEARDLQLLMNALLVQGSFSASTQNLNTAPLQAIWSNTLESYVGTANGNWEWRHTSGSTTFTITDNGSSPSTQGLHLLFASNPGFSNVAHVVSLEPNPDYPLGSPDNVVVRLRMNNGSIQTVTALVEQTNGGLPAGVVLMGNCDDPAPMECQSDEIRMAEDFAAFLNGMVDDTFVGKNDLVGNITGMPVPLNGQPFFSSRMQARLGGGLWEWNNVSTGATALSAVWQPAAGNGSTQSCSFDLDFVAAVPSFGFQDITSFRGFTVLTHNPQNGLYYDFQVVATYTNGSTVLEEVLEGRTSCFAIDNCSACLSQTSQEGNSFGELALQGNFPNAGSNGNVQLSLASGCPGNGQFVLARDASLACGANYHGQARDFQQATDHFLLTGALSGSTVDQLVWRQTVNNLLPNTDYVFQTRYTAVHLGTYTGQYEVYLKVNGMEVDRKIVDVVQLNVWERLAGAWNSVNGTNVTLELYLGSATPGDFPPMGFDDFSFRKGFLCPQVEEITLPELDPPADPCETWQNAIAMANAYQNYQEALDAFKNKFRRQYINKCLSSVVETFDMSFDDLEYHYTLYYYNRAGNLVRTVPPEGVVPVTNASDLTAIRNDRYNHTRTFFTQHSLHTTYHYNSLGQLVEQHTPDGGKTEFWYDALGRLVASQNAKQAANSSAGDYRYAYTRYDALGRTYEAGEMSLPNPIGSLAAGALDAFDYPDNVALSPRREVTRTFYDEAMLPNNGVAQFGGTGQRNLRSRVASAVFYSSFDPAAANPPHDYATHYSYDIHGNVDQLVQDDGLHPFADQQYKSVEYDYDLVSGNVNEVAYQKGEADAFYHRYAYDEDNRITQVATSDNHEVWDRDATYHYYQHGPLARIELGEDQVQGLDYFYTLQGWLKGVNSEGLTQEADPGHDGTATTNGLHHHTARDAMGFSLGYYSGDYQSIAALSGTSNPLANKAGSGLQNGTDDLYNGNIARMITAIDALGAPQAMGYRYDQLNRLKRAQRYSDFDAAANAWGPATADPDYRVDLTYDANGNILSLKRNGTTAGGNALAMDDLSYTYLAGTNKLDHVDDLVASANYTTDIDAQNAGNYDYDQLGQLTQDEAEEIKEILWTLTGKVSEVIRKGFSTKPDLEFRYDGLGNRIAKIVKPKETNGNLKPANEWTTTYYTRDAQGNVMATYAHEFADHDPSGAVIYNEYYNLGEHHLYGSSRLGLKNGGDFATLQFIQHQSGNTPVVMPVNSPSSTDLCRSVGRKAYELSNHLGNVLVTVSDRKLLEDGDADGNNDYAVAAVSSYSDYYPFGSLMPDRNGGSHRYGFNGMERNDEMEGSGNSYITYFRILNSRLGRWHSPDPESHKLPNKSPYQTFSNNPIIYIDPAGDTDFYNRQGDWIGTDGDPKTSDIKVVVKDKKLAKTITKNSLKGLKYTQEINSAQIFQLPADQVLKEGMQVLNRTLKPTSQESSSNPQFIPDTKGGLHEEGSQFTQDLSEKKQLEPGSASTTNSTGQAAKIKFDRDQKFENGISIHSHPTKIIVKGKGNSIYTGEIHTNGSLSLGDDQVFRFFSLNIIVGRLGSFSFDAYNQNYKSDPRPLGFAFYAKRTLVLMIGKEAIQKIISGKQGKTYERYTNAKKS